MPRMLLISGVVLLLGLIKINATDQRSKHRADQMIRDICEGLNDDDLYSDENRKRYLFYQEWIEKKEEKQDESITDESYTTHNYRPRRARGSRSSRFSRGGARSFRIRSNIGSFSGSPSSSSTVRFHSIHTGTKIIRPHGWQWSRTRLAFLPISTRLNRRYYPQYNRYTTLSTSSMAYYYCTSTNNRFSEIQCSTVDGDDEYCEDEATEQIYCCGGKISEDFIEEVNRAVHVLARVFYTLAAVTLSIHTFMRRFYY